ncbi:MAG TPA: histidine--tRNA ligase [Candidatus Absconditabacterales bacterium]|nr:histidine--tRNA ligase [Candidatus Absconditabacterales bacterium]HOQ79196.1 histidine--tRNA ligase [Candidatus Absconditabacterales bacterium]HPK27680.1 histidine--tRNA ligase [Candidatus Absconditabacterales bacterium]
MLSTQPAKGTQDRYPQEFQIRKYIFDSWRKVCLKFGYQEYLGPLVENAEIRKAKSGEDVGGSELTMITNREGKISELALRPEMTPTVTRMVAKNYAQLAKPIRYFSIANFYRNERPQRGRNREFRQLNVDMFGSDSIYADVEILTLAISLMLEFNPPKGSWKLNINNRFIIDSILSEIGLSGDIKQETVRLMDKREKLPQEAISEILLEKGLNQNQVNMLVEYMNSSTIQDLIKKFPSIQDSKGIQQTNFIIQSLNNLGYSEYLEFKPSLIRGFDYYDGVVFEIFDTHPDNKRALFGGGRYNGLSKIFIKDDIPAIGFAPGDETTKLFLESRGLIDPILNKTQIEKIYIPVLEDSLQDEVFKLAMNFRNYGKNVITGLETQKMIKAIQYADKQDYKFIVIFGEEEKEKGIYKVKNLKSGKEKEFKLNEDFSVEELN